MNVRKMIKEMGSRTQILEWMSFVEANGPLGDRRRDYHAAQIVAALFNVNRNTKRFPELFPVASFLLEFNQALREIKAAPPTKRDWSEIKAIAKGLASMYNAELIPMGERARRARQKKR